MQFEARMDGKADKMTLAETLSWLREHARMYRLYGNSVADNEADKFDFAADLLLRLAAQPKP